MARVNVEESAFGDRRLPRLAERMSWTVPQTMGHLVMLWHESQENVACAGTTEQIAAWAWMDNDESEGRRFVKALAVVGYIREVGEPVDGVQLWQINGNEAQLHNIASRTTKARKGGSSTKAKWLKLLGGDSLEPGPSVPQLGSMQDNARQDKTRQSSRERDPLDLALAQRWADYAKTESKTARPNIDEWTDAVRLLRSDGFTHADLDEMLAFARADDEFWRDKATSLSGLRRRSKNGLLKAENLRNSMRSAQRQRSAPATTAPKKSRPPVMTSLEDLKKLVD